MCTYLTTTTELAGSGRDGGSWFRLASGVVYYDHPQDALVEHALCLDVYGRDGERLAVELDAPSARRLARAILDTLAHPEVRLLEGDLDDEGDDPGRPPGAAVAAAPTT